jgi:hypothetical protein
MQRRIPRPIRPLHLSPKLQQNPHHALPPPHPQPPHELHTRTAAAQHLPGPQRPRTQARPRLRHRALQAPPRVQAARANGLMAPARSHMQRGAAVEVARFGVQATLLEQQRGGRGVVAVRGVEEHGTVVGEAGR